MIRWYRFPAAMNIQHLWQVGKAYFTLYRHIIALFTPCIKGKTVKQDPGKQGIIDDPMGVLKVKLVMPSG